MQIASQEYGVGVGVRTILFDGWRMKKTLLYNIDLFV